MLLYFLSDSLDAVPDELDFDVIEFGLHGDVQIAQTNKNGGLNPPSTVSHLALSYQNCLEDTFLSIKCPYQLSSYQIEPLPGFTSITTCLLALQHFQGHLQGHFSHCIATVFDPHATRMCVFS